MRACVYVGVYIYIYMCVCGCVLACMRGVHCTLARTCDITHLCKFAHEMKGKRMGREKKESIWQIKLCVIAETGIILIQHKLQR